MDSPISISGPVETKEGGLALIIPFEAGGKALAPLAEKISYIEDDCLIVGIPNWLAAKLNIQAGSRVNVSNANGKFTITREADSSSSS